VSDALASARLEPEALCLEITESAVVHDTAIVRSNLRDLKDMGVRLALDDFGVGFSSLSQIRELPPVDVIKLDSQMTHTGARWWPWAAAMELETHAGVAPTLSHSEARKVDDGILVACGLAVGAGSIHIAAGIEHLHDYALHTPRRGKAGGNMRSSRQSRKLVGTAGHAASGHGCTIRRRLAPPRAAEPYLGAS